MTEATFEANMKELEELVGKLEEGSLTLEQSLAAHARGLALVKAAQAQLAQAQTTLTTLESLKN